jgi:hypothetical protein
MAALHFERGWDRHVGAMVAPHAVDGDGDFHRA